jgi:hypothetical protein
MFVSSRHHVFVVCVVQVALATGAIHVHRGRGAAERTHSTAQHSAYYNLGASQAKAAGVWSRSSGSEADDGANGSGHVSATAHPRAA